MKKIFKRSGWGQSHNFGQGSHNGTFENVPFKQRLERDEAVSHVVSRRKAFQTNGTESAKAFEAGACLELRNSKEASVDVTSE